MKHRIYWALVAIFAALVVALGASMAPAGSYTLGEGGYYWKDGVAYQDHGYWWQEYYTAYTYSACGCYKYPYQTYRWKWHYDYRPVKLDYEATDIESQVIQLAAYRDKEVLKIVAREKKSQAAAALADQLGLSGNFNLPGYGLGMFPVRAYAGAAVYQKPLEQRAFEYSQSVDAYGPIDPMVLMQQNNRFLEQFLQTVPTLSAAQSQLTAQALASKERVETIRENGKVAVELLRNSQPGPSTRVETRIFGQVKGSAAAVPLPPAEAAGARPAFATAAKSCVQCHTGAQRQGGFDITTYHPATATAREKKLVYDYVTSDNPDRRCPKGQPALSDDTVQALIFAPKQAPEQLTKPPVPEP